MPIDEIAETGFRAISNVIRWLAWDLLIDVICFQVGRSALLVLTLGRYPKGRHIGRHRGRISIAGMLVFVAIWGAIAISNNL